MRKILVAGSLAYDQLTEFSGVFQEALKSHGARDISLAFPVTNKQIFFGGCGGNIVFNGRLAGKEFLLLGIAGKDFGPYEKWLKKNRIGTSLLIREPKDFTSEASVVTDCRGQQMAIFYPGAAAFADRHRAKLKRTVARLAKQLLLLHIAPNDRHFMLACIEGSREHGVPYFFDPGQAMSLFTPPELRRIIQDSHGLFLNEYEHRLIQKQLAVKALGLARLTPLTIVTLGEKGADIYWQERKIHIPSKKPASIKDPTGCGDAWRGGFLASIAPHFPNLTPAVLKKAGRSGTRLALKCLQTVGTQNHG